jgi:diaminopimelate epimerase
VVQESQPLRYSPLFAPQGTNVNFIEPERIPGGTILRVRTYEKGVEDETLACGTGIVASAIAAYSQGIPVTRTDGERVFYDVKAAIATLSVDFIPEGAGENLRVRDVWLTGPTAFIGTVSVVL